MTREVPPRVVDVAVHALAVGSGLVRADRGRVVAVIQAPMDTQVQGVPLPNREGWIAKLSKQKSDSAELTSADRDR